jgi:hypothetical protein
MHSAVTIRSGRNPSAPPLQLPRLAATGPFVVQDIAHRGWGVWTFTLRPAAPEMAIGFGKVAEFLVLLAREFDVAAVEQVAAGTWAAAS